MFEAPSTLPPDREQELAAYREELRFRSLDAVEALLADVESDAAREQVYELAFDPSRALPKRSQRPKLETLALAEQLYLAHDPDGTDLATVCEFTVAVTEYYDIADDLVDGDVAPEDEDCVFLVLQVLLSLFVERLGRLGGDVVAYWSRRARRLTGAPFGERRQEPSLAAYLDILDLQAGLFGFVTGVSALAAGAADDAVARAERVGRRYYRCEQFVVDCRQHGREAGEPWNLYRFVDADEAASLLAAERSALAAHLEGLPAERRERIRSLFAVDVAAVHERHHG
ncbi:hypothetical protein [Haloarchaeobius iranensis]|uniref:Geranylgeranyl diphosphate synthase, type I n=1 Tax=Haloarchaeobius iranensis TaxID=996166 RepID=A0A1H0AAG3_9EURY|nr:hypothetical protein [Haloarchaeobius iranensis]SDN29696.1 hypothetical protein SAMN05192554_12535 [Haloarchaeobius iranensis]